MRAFRLMEIRENFYTMELPVDEKLVKVKTLVNKGSAGYINLNYGG